MHGRKGAHGYLDDSVGKMGQKLLVAPQYLVSSFLVLEVFSLAHGYPERQYISQPCLQLNYSYD